MTKVEVMGRLEVLLDRVRSRAAEPRRRGAVEIGTGVVAEASPPLAARGAIPAVSTVVQTSVETSAPMVDRKAMPIERAAVEANAPVTIPEAVEAERATKDEQGSEGHDSRERLVAAEPTMAVSATAEPVPRARDSIPVTLEAESSIDLAEVDAADERVDEQEDEEPPASSRRTMASQPQDRLDQIAFGADDPQGPTHTPPPESGPLPAATGPDFDPDEMGVRNPTPLLPRRPAVSAPRELVPEALRPALVPSDAVAEMLAEAQRFAPSTFVALLDASLELYSGSLR